MTTFLLLLDQSLWIKFDQFRTWDPCWMVVVLVGNWASSWRPRLSVFHVCDKGMQKCLLHRRPSPRAQPARDAEGIRKSESEYGVLHEPSALTIREDCPHHRHVKYLLCKMTAFSWYPLRNHRSSMLTKGWSWTHKTDLIRQYTSLPVNNRFGYREQWY